jgi:ABC-2 type transport system permease protein
MGRELTLRRIGRLAQALVILIWALSVLDLEWSVGKTLILAFAINGGIALFVGIVILQATLSFWTIETLEIMNSLTYGGVETAQYPLDVYRRWFQRFFTFFVPLACVTFYPLSAILEKETPGFPRAFGVVSPIFGFLFAGIALACWRYGIRHYTSTGS